MKKNAVRRGLCTLGLAGILTAGSSLPVWAGWISNGDQSWGYQKEDGSFVTDGFSPDGYYLNGEGRWYEKISVLGVEIMGQNIFLESQSMSFSDWNPALEKFADRMTEEMGNKRGFTISESELACYMTEGSKGTKRLMLHRETESRGYRLEISCPLRKDRGYPVSAAWYDYQTLRFFLLHISRCGDKLADAVYQSWESDNAYGLKIGQWVRVGDCQIRYSPGNGTGIYEIIPVPASEL